MSRRYVRVLAGAATALCAASAGAQVFVEGVNNELPVQDTWTATGGHEQAFRWTPKNSFDLGQILWHSSPIAAGTIRLREDTGVKPGATLREVDFSSTTDGWNGAPFSEPYAVVAGQTYFVTFQSRSGDYRKFICEDLPGVVVLTYYWTPDGGVLWNGPFTFAGRRMIEFYMPEDTGCYADCDESGALDFFDFLCFQNLFGAGDPAADCDESGALDFFDFLCFKNAFAAGCP
jgi:hypothetical protein